MENAPIDGLELLEKHLNVLVQKPETPFDAKLFDDVELQLTRKWIVFHFVGEVEQYCLPIPSEGFLKTLHLPRMKYVVPRGK